MTRGGGVRIRVAGGSELMSLDMKRLRRTESNPTGT